MRHPLQVNLSEEAALPSLELAGEWRVGEEQTAFPGLQTPPVASKVWDTAQAMPAAVADRTEGCISTFTEELYRWRVNTQVRCRALGVGLPRLLGWGPRTRARECVLHMAGKDDFS